MKLVLSQLEVERLITEPLSKDAAIRVKKIEWPLGTERFAEVVLEANK